MKEVAQTLQENLGQRLTAFAVGIRDPKEIGRYARGEREPTGYREVMLIRLYTLVKDMLEHDSPESIRAWMMGANPSLDDRAPVEMFRAGKTESVRRAAEEMSRG